MRFDPGLEMGDKITFAKLREIFACGNMGGMLYTKKYKTLVIISNETKGIYPDKWMGPILHYVGMGRKGDQTLKGNSNKILYESDTNGVTVHLFVVLKKNEYTYKGIVELADKPYNEMQPDDDGMMRQVWVFPVKVIEDSTVEENEADERLIDKVANLPISEVGNVDFIYTGEPKEKGLPVMRNNIKVYTRSSKTAMRALSYAEFKCEYNESHPTFISKKTDRNYVEPHHLVPMKYSELFDVSLDIEENIISLCSNCHKQLHYGRDYEDILEDLYNRRKGLLKQVGIDISWEQLRELYSAE